MNEPLKVLAADDLRPAETTAAAGLRDIVEIMPRDGSAGVLGRVEQLLGEGWLKVSIEGIGVFAVAPCRATVRERAQ